MTGCKEESENSFVAGWSSAAAGRLKAAIKVYGSQGQVAEKAGISRQSLTEILSFDAEVGKGSRPRYKSLNSICSVIGVTPDKLLFGDVAAAAVESSVVAIPRLIAVASAGNGVVAEQDALADSPFHLAEQWLRSRFGSVKSLRVVQVSGASQEPDLRDGDWVLIDEARNAVEDGLAVVRRGDSLLVKRLHREGHVLHLLSKNPEYPPTAIDLRHDESDIQVIGKVVYSFKAV